MGMSATPPPTIKVSSPVDEESRPLLSPRDQNAQSYESTSTEPSLEEIVNDNPDADPKKRSYLDVAFWGVVAVFAIVVIALLIKGFIEADDYNFDFGKAFKSALGGGLSGAAAMVLQVLVLMPIRTIMNYQYRYGSSLTVATRTLYHDGGWARYYQGLIAALFQGPISRFGDTAANTGIQVLFESNSFMKDLPELVKTPFASLVAAAFRIVICPIDTVKTTMQAQGKKGWPLLKNRIRIYGIWSLWYGALGSAAATFVGHYPWFGTYNLLQRRIPDATGGIFWELLRQAFIGFCASVVSDTISNSLRVLKTYRQVNHSRIGYANAARAVIQADGWRGLFGRGLKTRILANGLQGLMFSVLWKLFLDLWNDKT